MFKKGFVQGLNLCLKTYVSGMKDFVDMLIGLKSDKNHLSQHWTDFMEFEEI